MVELGEFAEVSPGIHSSLSPGERAASYDRLAFGYDLLVGNALYNRIVWGCPKLAYRRNAAAFLSAAPRQGELLDLGCGSLVFTAQSYCGAEDRLLLLDRSLGMLERGKSRLANGRFLQGDALNAPFAQASFAGVCGWGMLHIFGTRSGYLESICKLAAKDAPVAIGTLTKTGRGLGDRMLTLLAKKGEAAEPETPEQVIAAFEKLFRIERSEQCGNMLFVHGRRD